MVPSRHQRGPARLHPHPERQQQQTKVDAQSGLIITETSVSAVTQQQHLGWIRELKTPSLAKKQGLNSSGGARSLVETARRRVVREFQHLTAEHFASIPWEVGQKIWQEAVEGHRESFHAWTVLASAYSDADEFGRPEYRYHLDFSYRSLPLRSCLDGIASAQCSWLVALRLSPKETRVADLMLLVDVPNLAVLDLSDGQVSVDPLTSSSFDERVMKVWSELASSSSSSSFKQLRVLLLGWQVHIDQWLFKYLSLFPNLQQVIVSDCPKLHQKNRKEWQDTATVCGWEARHSKRSAKSLRPHLDERNFATGAVSGLYYTTLHGSPSRPMLECWIGRPKMWLHILDDFPGTRTIYFDRVQGAVTPVAPTAPVAAGAIGTKRVRLPQVSSSASIPTPTASPQPKRMQRHKVRTAAVAPLGRSELDDLLSHYVNKPALSKQ